MAKLAELVLATAVSLASYLAPAIMVGAVGYAVTHAIITHTINKYTTL